MLDKIDKEKVVKGVVTAGVIALVVIAFIYGVEALRSQSRMPDDIDSAYKQAVERGRTITNSIQSVAQKTQEISDMDLEESGGEKPLSLVGQAKKDADRMQKAAEGLVNDLDFITRNIRSINDPADQQEAFRAVVVEVQFLQQLFPYMEELDEFLNSLEVSIASGNTDVNIQSEVDQMKQNNKDLTALNDEFVQKVKGLGVSIPD